jgi:translation initiation factor IF-1
MVKNTTGGSGHKSQARKLVDSGNSGKLRLSLNESEKYARVSKMFGNGMCLVTTQDNLELTCHIRGKFRGRNKKNNLVSLNSTILVGLREWENPPKNCDLLFLYEHLDIPFLPNLLPTTLQDDLLSFDSI